MKKRGRVKKRWIILSVILIIVIGGVLGFCLINKNIENFHKQILEVIKPDIDNYCQDLKDSYYGIGCPTCSYADPNYKDLSYLYVRNLNEESPPRTHKYTIKKEDDMYNVMMELYLTYGRSDYVGSALLSFDIDKNWEIISKNLTKEECH